ncbi:hypothetical protein [Lentiprolixibacter aurantiacus]|uniref:Uncharacterized protein n=1 Tax=Lentiprolixibacter aurantiacus TaxID=2993939 RepID=A0AAE3MMQ5_9FLAO|nr:hypothetical protein [Lentiprolixibacter aurantiacus]MCX2720288.1 hypothetical protein [Lentiprolixibacter aurantiacus]
MRTQKIKTLILGLIFMVPALILAQDNSPQAFWVHEDVVKPGMVGEYEAVCKELLENMKTHNIQNDGWIVTNTADSRYLFVGAIDNMADLDKSPFPGLAEKMGGDKMGALFGRMDKCYDTEHDYVIYLDKELSYMPGGITQTPEGQNYRKFHYLYFTPEKRATVREKMKAVKDLFVAKGSKVDYRVYRSGFGNRGEYYMVAIAAKDPVDYAQSGMDNQKLLGEDGQKVMGELWGNLLKYEEIAGQMRPDMAYSPSN